MTYDADHIINSNRLWFAILGRFFSEPVRDSVELPCHMPKANLDVLPAFLGCESCVEFEE